MAGKTKNDVGSGNLLTLRDASTRTGLSDWTLRRWALEGRIDSVKLGGRRLIPEKVLSELIERNYEKASAPEALQP